MLWRRANSWSNNTRDGDTVHRRRTMPETIHRPARPCRLQTGTCISIPRDLVMDTFSCTPTTRARDDSRGIAPQRAAPFANRKRTSTLADGGNPRAIAKRGIRPGKVWSGGLRQGRIMLTGHARKARGEGKICSRASAAAVPETRVAVRVVSGAATLTAASGDCIFLLHVLYCT